MITLTELKTYLWITTTSQDDLLNLLKDWAIKFIKTYIWREIEAIDYIEYKDWNWQTELLLNYPVNTLTSISLNTWTLNIPVWEVVEATNYKLSNEIWKVFFVSYLSRWFWNYKVIYNAWYTTIPWDLKLACLKLASKYYNTRTSDWISWESVNWDSINFWTTDIPKDIAILLNSYRDIYV